MTSKLLKTCALVAYILIILVNESCDFKKEMDEVAKEYLVIGTYIKEISNCDLIEITDYKKVNRKRKKISMNLIGCSYQDPNIEAKRIHDLLKSKFEFYCDINLIEYNFINDGKAIMVKYYSCNEL